MYLSGYTKLEQAIDLLSNDFHARIMRKAYWSSEEAYQECLASIAATKERMDSLLTEEPSQNDIRRLGWHIRCQKLREYAQRNRRRKLKAEIALKQELGRHPKAHIFWWQGIILPYYIVDFVCYRCKLIIEVDGPDHKKIERQDWIRTQWLNRRGFNMRRFTNEAILADARSAVESIAPCRK